MLLLFCKMSSTTFSVSFCFVFSDKLLVVWGMAPFLQNQSLSIECEELHILGSPKALRVAQSSLIRINCWFSLAVSFFCEAVSNHT